MLYIGAKCDFNCIIQPYANLNGNWVTLAKIRNKEKGVWVGDNRRAADTYLNRVVFFGKGPTILGPTNLAFSLFDF